jgi:hypothetical protein
VAAFAILIALTIAAAANSHEGGWASHSSYAAGGPPDARTQARCRTHRCRHKVYWDRKYRELSASDKRWLYLLRSCETTDGADEHDPSWSYHGRYQFSLQTAWSAGFTLDPHAVYNHEEDVRTVRWRNRAGSGQWPNCAPW